MSDRIIDWPVKVIIMEGGCGSAGAHIAQTIANGIARRAAFVNRYPVFNIF